MDCNPPGSCVHGIVQARKLEWLPFPSPAVLLNPGIEPGSPALQADALLSEPQGSPYTHICLLNSLGREDPLEKGMTTYSSNLAWIIPWTEEPGGLQSMGLQIVRHDSATKQQLEV